MASCESLGFLTLTITLLAGNYFKPVTSNALHQAEVSSSVVQPGESATFRCRVPEADIPPANQIFWGKRQQVEGVHDVVTSGGVIMDKYKSLGRFAVMFEEEGEELISVLTITEADLVDSGEYGCMVALTDDDFDTAAAEWVWFSVADPVKAVHIFGLNAEDVDDPEGKKVEFEDGQEVTLEDHGQYFIRCEFYGSNPEADVQVTFGDEDITANFNVERASDLEASSEDGDINTNFNLNYLRHHVFLVTRDPLYVDTERRRHKLVCSGSVEGQEEPTSITIIPVMSVAVELECPVRLMVLPHQRNVSLTCNVTANPPISGGLWSWELLGGSTDSIELGKSYKGVHGVLSKVVDDVQAVSLRFDYAAETMFRPYNLTIKDENNHEYTAQVHLIKDNTGASVGGAPSLLSLSHCLLAAVFFFTVGKYL